MGVPGSRSQGGHREPGMLISLAPQRAPVNRSTTDFSMDQPSLQDSTKYPPGYGDFALHCSDNIICYFPRHLLEYMSPVFKDMFSLAAEASDSVAISKLPQSPLKLTESSAVIETLLEHIDPKSKRALIIDPATIIELLEAARKCQVSAITEWFMDEAVLHQRDLSSGKSILSEPFSSTHPDLALQCAIRFDCPMVGRRILADPKIQMKSIDIRSSAYIYTSIAYIYQCKAREAHVQRYQSYISALLTDLKGHLNFREQNICRACRNFLSGWFLDMERAVMVSPRWNSFSQAYESGDRCELHSCGSPVRWSDAFRSRLSAWKTEAMKLEDALPEWPFVDHFCTFS